MSSQENQDNNALVGDALEEQSLKRSRRSFAPEQKAAILSQIFLGKVSVASASKANAISTQLLSSWMQQAINALPDIFATKRKKSEDNEDPQLLMLQRDLAARNDLIASMAIELYALRKELNQL